MRPSRTRRVFTLLLLATLAGAASGWLWHQPGIQNLIYAWQLQQAPAPMRIAVPVQDVQATAIADTWGAARSGGRQHQGVDIFAPRGTPVLSSTEGLVVSVREGGLGGKQVWVLGPGGERHYYAHLDDWAPGLGMGDRVQPGDMLGVVGDTGNAKGTPPHLHYGIYTGSGAVNPRPRLHSGSATTRDAR